MRLLYKYVCVRVCVSEYNVGSEESDICSPVNVLSILSSFTSRASRASHIISTTTTTSKFTTPSPWLDGDGTGEEEEGGTPTGRTCT